MSFVIVHLKMIVPWCYVPISNLTAIRHSFFFVEHLIAEHLIAGLFPIRSICFLYAAPPLLNRNAYASHEVTPLKLKQKLACPGTHSCMKRLEMLVEKFELTSKRDQTGRSLSFFDLSKIPLKTK